MKTLYIVRHAKSSWDYPELSDFDRPLNNRGQRDAPKMGKYLAEKGIVPDLLLSSPANRALTTAKTIAELVGHTEQIRTDRRIYHASENTLLAVLQEQEKHHKQIMIFGHNPGFTGFSNALTDDYISNIPTCGVVQIDFDVDSWQKIKFGKGRLIFFQYPKGLS